MRAALAEDQKVIEEEVDDGSKPNHTLEGRMDL